MGSERRFLRRWHLGSDLENEEISLAGSWGKGIEGKVKKVGKSWQVRGRLEAGE